MDLDETLIQYGKSLGEELCIKERIWYRERFGCKLGKSNKTDRRTDRASYRSASHLKSCSYLPYKKLRYPFYRYLGVCIFQMTSVWFQINFRLHAEVYISSSSWFCQFTSYMTNLNFYKINKKKTWIRSPYINNHINLHFKPQYIHKKFIWDFFKILVYCKPNHTSSHCPYP